MRKPLRAKPRRGGRCGISVTRPATRAQGRRLGAAVLALSRAIERLARSARQARA